MSTSRLPEQVRSLVPRGQRVLAWAMHRGGHVVATNQALISTDTHDSTIIPWGHTVAARWNEPMLTVYVQDDLGSKPQPIAWMIDEPGQLPHAVHDRVTGANLVDLEREVSGVGPVRFIARRGQQGTTWTTVLGSGVSGMGSADLSDVQQSAITQALAELRSTLGI